MKRKWQFFVERKMIRENLEVKEFIKPHLSNYYKDLQKKLGTDGITSIGYEWIEVPIGHGLTEILISELSRIK